MSKLSVIGFSSPKVYCWRCGRLTRLKEAEDGLAPCSFCGAPMLRWYLQKMGLAEKQAPQNAQSNQKPINPEQEGISQQKGELGGNTP